MIPWRLAGVTLAGVLALLDDVMFLFCRALLSVGVKFVSRFASFPWQYSRFRQASSAKLHAEQNFVPTQKLRANKYSTWKEVK